MVLKNCLMFSLLLVTLSSLAFAEIKISPVQRSVYNFGDTVLVSAFVKQTEHLQGVLKLTISCGNYTLTYSAIPLILDAGVEKEIATSLILIDKMDGECRIAADYESDDSFTEKAISDKFTVTKDLDIEVVIDTLEFLPEQEMVIAGTVKKKSGDYVSSGTILLNFQDNDYKVDIKNGRFIYKIKIPPNAKSGMQNLLFLVKDKNRNKGELTKEITITAVPSGLDLKLNRQGFKPLETLEITPYLYEQSNSTIEREVSLEIVNPKNKKILEKTVLTNNIFSYVFEQHALPGEYKIRISMEKLSKEVYATVKEVEELDLKIDGNVVYIKNIGNVLYRNTTTIILESKNKKYVLNKNLRLMPGETVEIDLSKEVKGEVYDIILPTIRSEENIENISKTIKQGIIKNVTIPDKRGLIKKTTQGLADITGHVITSGNKPPYRPILALAIVIALIISIAFYYNKRKQRIRPEEEMIILNPAKKED